MKRSIWFCIGFLAVGTMTQSSFAQNSTPRFPRNPASWLNSSPITEETLKGKAALLYFFEDGWPKCSGKWPEFLAVAGKYKGKPIAFIAVNSGSPPANVAAYLRKNRVTWPVIVDMDRSFERQCNIKISLQNIAQLRIINAQGQMTSASWSNLTGAANRALVGARWNVDPTGIPATMHQTWLAIEFGDYPSAAAGLKRSLNSRKRETKAAAEKLQAYVQAKIDSDLKVANEALESEKKWDAYKTLTRAQIMFKGYKLPRDFAAQVRSLAADDSVKKERAAMKRFESASKAINSKSVSSHKRGMSILKKLVAGSPDTEAATRATTLLKAIESSVNP